MSPSRLEYFLYWTVRIGAYCLPLTLFFVSRDFLFPYVTVKGFLFRALILVIGAAWGGLVLLNRKRYAPPWNRITIALSLLLASTIASAVFGVNGDQSFWSNFERMEGVVLYLHLFLLFCALSGTFHTAREWHSVFYATIAVGAVTSIHSITIFMGNGGRTSSAFGNALYFAIFLVFQIFFLFFFFVREKHRYVRCVLLALLSLHIVALLLTGARSVFFGFLAGSFLALFFWGLIAYRRYVRWFLACGALLFLFIVPFVIQFMRSAPSRDQENDNALVRLSRISFENTSVQNRLLLWKIAWRAFFDRPLFGWGSDNFIVAYANYYDPRLYGYEFWSDRAHNVLFEWLVAGGVVGIVAFFLLLTAIVLSLFGATRRGSFSHAEAAVFAALGIAYGVQMLFTFDTLSTYFMNILVFGFFASASSRAQSEWRVPIVFPPLSAASVPRTTLFAIAGLFCVALVSLFFTSVRPLLAARTAIDASRVVGNSAEAQRLFIRSLAFARGTIGATEIREQLVRSLFMITTPERLRNDPGLQELYRFTIREMEQEVARTVRTFPRAKALFSLARLWYIRGIFLRDSFALQQSLVVYEKIRSLVPDYIPLYPLFAEALVAQGDVPAAEALLDRAVSRVGAPHRYNTDIFYTKPLLYVTLGKYDRALDAMRQFPSSLRTKALEPTEKGLLSVIQTARVIGGEKAIPFIEQAHQFSDPTSFVTARALAEMYAEKGDTARALFYIKEAFTRDGASAEVLYPLLRQMRVR